MAARYHFRLTNGPHFIEDVRGTTFSSIVAARQYATRRGSLLVNDLNLVVQVYDDGGNLVLAVPLVIDSDPVAAGDPKSYDPITRLPLRSLFLELLTTATTKAAADEQSLAVILVDVDALKESNDRIGYSAGDAVLRHFADVLTSAYRNPPAVVARLEGDKFGVLITDLGSSTDVMVQASETLIKLRTSILFDGAVLRHGGTIGASIFPDHGDTPMTLLQSADIALHAAKIMLPGGAVLYTPSLREEQKKRSAALNTARSALDDGRILPHYQPQISLRTGRIVGFEALLRWTNSEGQIGSPGQIAEALDHQDLAARIGRTIQEKVCHDIAAWKAEKVQFGHVAINASPVELISGRYARQLIKCMRSGGLEPDSLELEITETAISERGSEKLYGELEELRLHGIKVFLDDFGTGYGSLVHLRELPVDGVKVDRSFVRDITREQDALAIVRAILQLAKDLQLSVVAEGVETQEQATALRSVGCDVAQGFLYSRALPFGAVKPFIASWSPTARGIVAMSNTVLS